MLGQITQRAWKPAIQPDFNDRVTDNLADYPAEIPSGVRVIVLLEPLQSCRLSRRWQYRASTGIRDLGSAADCLRLHEPTITIACEIPSVLCLFEPFS
jgi:hypothetical protein